MSSVKCSNCGLVNFNTTQYCKRCNLALSSDSAGNQAKETRILNDSYNTGIRSTVPPPNNYQSNGYQNEPQSYKQSYQPNQYQSQSNHQQPPANDWTLPQFPKGQRPPNYNQQYQPRQHQSYNQFAVHEPEIRRFGSEIALHKNANLPCYCVKCGKHIFSLLEGDYVSQKFRWHNPLVYIALISPLIYLILALCLSKTFTVNVPLCSEHLQKRENAKYSLLGGGLAAFGLIVMCSVFDFVGLAFLIFFAAIIALPLVFEYSYKPLRAKNIEGNYYHLGGASPEFLNTIPY